MASSNVEVPKQFKHDAKGKLDPWIFKILRFLNFINTSPTESQIMYYLWKIRKQANRRVFIVLNYFGYSNLLISTFTMILDYRNFLSGFFFTDTDNSQDNRGREGTIFYSTLPLHPLTNIQTFIFNFALSTFQQDDCHIFLIATLVFTRLLLDEIYHLIELLFHWLMM